MQKRIIILIIVLVLLVGALILINNMGTKSSTMEEKPVFTISKDKVVTVKIKKPLEKDALRFEKVPDGWDIFFKVDEKELTFKADKSMVENFISKLSEIKIVTSVTKNPDKQSEFSVDEGSGIEIEVAEEENKNIPSFILGRSSKDGKDTFFRFSKKDTIYKISGNIRDMFNKNLDEYREKRIFTLKQEDITQFILTGEKIANKNMSFKSETIAKPDDPNTPPSTSPTAPEEKKTEIKWMNNTTNKEVVKSSIDSFLRTLTSIRIDKYIDNVTDQYKVTNPQLTITFTTASEGTTLFIDRLEKDGEYKDKYLAHVENRATPYYYVNKGTIDELLKIQEIKNADEKKDEKK